jgi:membrane associated rhomboid family serine protease
MGTRVHPVVWGTVLLLVAIELVLEAGDAGLLPPLRQASYLLAVGAIPWHVARETPGAMPLFFGGLVGHALLHGGWMHLAFNAVGLICLGHVVQAQAGTRAFLLASVLTAVAGAIAFRCSPPPTAS